VQVKEIKALYEKLMAAWNKRDASAFAALFTLDANLIGFDGSQVNGRNEIQSHLGKIFKEHKTPPFVSIVRNVRLLNESAAVLSANVGMMSESSGELDPALNAVQTLVACRVNGRWQICVFQNTPAALHGRPDAVKKLTDELRKAASV
jgi:uncharacterized protein (TIGR02246 family)